MISLSLSQRLLEDLALALGEPSFESSSDHGRLISKALKFALEEDVAPGLVRSSYRDAESYRPYYLSKSLELKLKKALKEHSLVDPSASLSSLTMKLLSAVASLEKQVDGKESGSDHGETWIRQSGMEPRAEQLKMIKEIKRGLAVKDQPILFSEASVGVGKSLIMAVIALVRAQELKTLDSDEAVILAAPTYQIAVQLEGAVLMLAESNALNVTTKMVRSRSEYISTELVLNAIETMNQTSDLVTAIKGLLSDKIYLRHEYESAGLDCKNLTLSRHTSPDDLAEEEYQIERSSNLDANIIVCTHAFLACHASSLRRRLYRSSPQISGDNYIEFNKACLDALQENPSMLADNRMLPPINLLVIDEAHTLYGNYQSLQESRIPLSSLERTIKKILGHKNATADKLAFIDDFILTATSKMNGNRAYPAAITNILNKGIKGLMPLVKAKKNTPEKMLFLEFADQIQEMASSKQGQHEVYISPIQSKCSISVSKGRPEAWLNMTWLLTRSGVCVSGTLATGNGIECYYPMASQLCVDHQRVVSVQPIETSWLRKNVTLYAPPVSKRKEDLSKFKHTAFLPPSDKAGLIEWVEKQALVINEFLKDSIGGVMIVCTSYEQIDLLYSLVNTMDSLIGKPIHLFKSTRSVSLVSQVNEFKQSYLAGSRPVWIAISSAGTGIDITDRSSAPVDDHMLSHLFVTRLPIASSSKNQNYMQVIEKALVDFKQILGRLVRRPGRKNMNLYVLDARARVEIGSYRRFKFLLDKYEQQKII